MAKLKLGVSTLTLLVPPAPKMPATCSSTLTTSLTMGAGPTAWAGLAGTTLRTGAGLGACGGTRAQGGGTGVSDEGGKLRKYSANKITVIRTRFCFRYFPHCLNNRFGYKSQNKVPTELLLFMKAFGLIKLCRGFCRIRSYGLFKKFGFLLNECISPPLTIYMK